METRFGSLCWRREEDEGRASGNANWRLIRIKRSRLARYAEIVIAAGPFEQDGGAGDAYDCRHEHVTVIDSSTGGEPERFVIKGRPRSGRRPARRVARRLACGFHTIHRSKDAP
jgi:hypothetical protein